MRAGLLVAVLTALAAACAPAGQKWGEIVSWSAAAPQPTQAPLVARPAQSSGSLPAAAPDFALQTIEWGTFRLSEQRGAWWPGLDSGVVNVTGLGSERWPPRM